MEFKINEIVKLKIPEQAYPDIDENEDQEELYYDFKDFYQVHSKNRFRILEYTGESYKCSFVDKECYGEVFLYPCEILKFHKIMNVKTKIIET